MYVVLQKKYAWHTLTVLVLRQEYSKTSSDADLSILQPHLIGVVNSHFTDQTTEAQRG